MENFRVPSAVLPAALLLVTACWGESAADLASSRDSEDWERAAELYESEIDTLMEAYTEDAYLHGKIGEELMTREAFGPAEEHIRRAIEIRPVDPRLWLDLGICLSNLARLDPARADEAEEAYRNAIRLDDRSYQAHYGLGQLLLQARSDTAAAEAEFRRVVMLDEENVDALASLGLIAYTDGRLLDALALYSSALDHEPYATVKRRDLLETLSVLYRQAGMPEEADRYGEDAAALSTGSR